jgi:flagellar protein FlgJ
MSIQGVDEGGHGTTRPVAELSKQEFERERLRKACRDFETIFLHELLKGLRRTVPDGGSQQKALYQSMLDEQLAREFAKRGLGLADQLYAELTASERIPFRVAAKDIHESSDRDSEERYKRYKGGLK